ncbi:hypothetical protein C8J57DRAFT_254599 [Mycena rebaudengoi]|nr:hypothetical protein C8J57DRAFT_254599 [Mycena rebaudengoi]
MTPPPAASRVYWLSSLAAILQKESEIFDETPDNPNDLTASSNNYSAGRTLNHISTCLTRGRSSEASRVVAVTSSTHKAGSISVQVLGTPPSSVTSSSSSTSGVAIGEEPMTPRSLVFTRNSATESIGQDDRAGLTMLTHIQQRPNPMPRNYILPLSFNEYVALTIRVLRTAAAITQDKSTSPIEREDIRLATCIYVIDACRSKLKSRVKAFFKLYRVEQLVWPANKTYPSEEIITTILVEVEDDALEIMLDHGGLAKQEGRYPFDALTLPTWWNVIIRLITGLHDQSSSESTDISHIALISRSLHHILQIMPHQLWKLETLNQHINRSRIIPTPSTVNPTEARENLESDSEEDIEVAEEAASLKNAMPFRPPSFPALPIAFAFYRAVDVLTAWTTAPLAVLAKPDFVQFSRNKADRLSTYPAN